MRHSALALICSLALVLLAPAAAGAQNPFGGGPNIAPPVQQEPEATKPADDGLSKGQTVLIMLVGAALLGGIAWAIVRDARRRDRSTDDGHEADRQRARVEREAERRRRKAATRKKSKAAKNARRSNRPR